MWSRFKAIPVVPKIILGCLLLLGIYGIAHPKPPRPVDPYFQEVGPAPMDLGEDRAQRDSPANGRQAADGTGAKAQLLAQFKAQHAQIMASANNCIVQMQQAMNQTAAAAVNGAMYSGQPACQQNMAQWTAQAAYLETEIYKLEGGDPHASVREVSGIPESSSTPSHSSAYGSSSSDGTEAVERATREGIRGHSLYNDEDGREYELDTRPYYFRDRASGRLVGSDQPYAPNDGRDYEQLTPRE